MNDIRIGNGYDVHRLSEGRKLIIGGVDVPYSLGLDGHSDADVLIHAIMDSVLGALGKGDIGRLFPDTDRKYKNIDSRILLRAVATVMIDMGYRIGNIDAVIIAQAPKMRPYIDDMRMNIAADLDMNVECINIKATTTEHLGFEGRGEGIASQSVCLLVKQ